MRHEVDIRLRADVPIGVFLSGGVDSSMIAAMIKERARDGQDITFYTARYPDGVSSDYPFAQKVAKDIGISLRSIDITFDEHALENFKTLSRHYDQPVPFAGSTISENVLLKSMADDGIRVAISGMGGDEVFGGYGNEYIEGAMHDMLSKNSLIDTAVFARQVVRSRLTTVPALALFALNRLRGKRRDNSSFRGLLQFIRPQYRDMVETISQNYWAREAFHSPMHKVQITDCIEGRLANYVVFSDTNSMMNSIETRSPFLGPTLTKYMALPPTDKYRDGFNKHALRRAMPASIDSSVTWRKQKQGFTFSFGKFYQMNKPAIHGIVKANTVLNQLIEIDSFLVALEGHPIEQKMSLALLSVAVYCESHECVL
jgi:asparagine synthase (glutamine-hydrolysing)